MSVREESNPEGWSISPPSLVAACRDHQLELAEALIENGADIYEVDDRGMNPFHHACRASMIQKSWIDVIMALVNRAKAVGDEDYINSKSKYPENKMTALHYTFNMADVTQVDENQLLEVVKILVQNGACPNKRDGHQWTPLHYACDGGQTEVARYLVIDAVCLLEERDNSGKSPLHIALNNLRKSHGHRCADIALFLINHGCGSESDKFDFLCGACSLGKLDIVKELIQNHRADPYGLDDQKLTPLHHACKGGNKVLVKYLVEELKCDIDVRDDKRRTPLDLAKISSNANIVHYFTDEFVPMPSILPGQQEAYRPS